MNWELEPKAGAATAAAANTASAGAQILRTLRDMDEPFPLAPGTYCIPYYHFNVFKLTVLISAFKHKLEHIAPHVE
jgi:hypothetical protein